MYRILIVEDDENTRVHVSQYLRELFGNSEVIVDTSETVEDARCLINEAELAYDCVILDFMLPKEAGHAPDGDLSLCGLVRERMPTTVVAHVSAFFGESGVLQAHIQEFHNELVDPRAIVLPKDENWVDRLGKMLRRHLYTKTIEDQLDDLFGRETNMLLTSSPLAEKGSGASSRGNTTCQLTRVSQDIAAHWCDLDDALKNRIRGLFTVIDKPGEPVRIGLL